MMLMMMMMMEAKIFYCDKRHCSSGGQKKNAVPYIRLDRYVAFARISYRWKYYCWCGTPTKNMIWCGDGNNLLWWRLYYSDWELYVAVLCILARMRAYRRRTLCLGRRRCHVAANHLSIYVHLILGTRSGVASLIVAGCTQGESRQQRLEVDLVDERHSHTLHWTHGFAQFLEAGLLFAHFFGQNNLL